MFIVQAAYHIAKLVCGTGEPLNGNFPNGLVYICTSKFQHGTYTIVDGPMAIFSIETTK